MKLQLAIFYILLQYNPEQVAAQTCTGVSGPFTLREITGTCSYETLLEEYTRQVFDMTGSTCSAGSTLTAQEDLDAKLKLATGEVSGQAAADVVCKAMYDNDDVTPFTKAAGKSKDPANLHFEQQFYNGRGEWQEEVETLYEAADESATSVLREDATRVREFYEGEGSYSRVQWPNMLTNFDDATCSSKAAMCCWPKDRQANDGNGNCAKPYDVNCVDKDPADNTNLCYADFAKGDASTNLSSASGFAVFPEDNNNGEGAIHCHGFAWADNDYDPISRYKANNLFFVSMYDHMHQRGYVEPIPGMPMCGCMDQMPIATRSDCTQVDLTEDWEMTFDGTSFTGKMIKVEIDFNSCQGRDGRNNDLWAYAARLYDEGRMTGTQFGKVGRVLTDDQDCYHATEYAKQQKGLVTGYTHNATIYTKVAGRDNMYDGEPFGREAFNKAFFEQSLTKPSSLVLAEGQTSFAVGETPIIMRICPDCTKTHRKIWYRRLTPIENSNFDLLHNILYHDSSSTPQGNIWDVDFSLHSSYDEAKTGANPWQCPDGDFDYRRPFVGNCSPDGTKVSNQQSVWDWFPGPRPNVAYYINKPEDVGVQDYIGNDSVTRAVGLTDIDIGAVGMTGNTWEEDGVFHITGSGDRIGGQSDQFHYKSQPWSGDIDITVNLKSFANNGGDSSAKAGIMLRSDTSPDATYAFALFKDTNEIKMELRRSKGKSASSSGDTYTPAACEGSDKTTCGCDSIRQQDYRGTISTTADGLTCQNWESQSPHDHSRTPSNYPDKGLGDHNYCRNPDNEDGAWCYTTDPDERWAYCDVPSCAETSTSAWLRIVKKLERIEFYRSEDAGVTWTLQAKDAILFPGDEYRVGLAVTSSRNDYLSEATFEDYHIQQYVFPTSAPSLSSAPTQWQPLMDIGMPQRAGSFSTSEAGDIEYVKGSGTGIWGSSDSFTFYNHQLPNEPVAVEMYIKHFDNGNLFGRAGLMVRDSNDADAANAFVGAAGGDLGAVFQSRPSAGVATEHHKMIYANWNNHMWVKITLEAGGDVTGYYKIDAAADYIELGTNRIALTGSTIQVGRAVTAGTDYEWAELTVETQNYAVL